MKNDNYYKILSEHFPIIDFRKPSGTHSKHTDKQYPFIQTYKAKLRKNYSERIAEFSKAKDNAYFNRIGKQDAKQSVKQNAKRKVTTKQSLKKKKPGNIYCVKKVRIYPNKDQQEKLYKMAEISRKAYNKTVKYIKTVLYDCKPADFPPSINKIKTRDILLPTIETKLDNNDQTKGKFSECQFVTIEAAIFAALAAYNGQVTKYKQKDIKNIRLREKKKSSPNQVIHFTDKAFSKEGVLCPRILKTAIPSAETIGKPSCYFSVSINSRTSSYYMIIPNEVQMRPISDTKNIIALDPGIRTFLTGYAIDNRTSCQVNILDKPERTLGNLIKKRDAYKGKPNYKNRQRYHRVLQKIKNRIRDIHHKAAKWLCLNYSHIILGKLSTSGILQNDLPGYTKDMASVLSHYTFRERLEHKCRKLGVKLTVQNEAYTTKTCSRCYNQYKIGKSKVYDCPKCSISLDRDYNSARNIMLKYFHSLYEGRL